MWVTTMNIMIFQLFQVQNCQRYVCKHSEHQNKVDKSILGMTTTGGIGISAKVARE
jgi:hypothetical protein